MSMWTPDPVHISTWNYNKGSHFWRGIMIRGHNSTWNYDPGSTFHVELWPRVRIPHWILIPIPGHNLTLNHDSGSKFNVELRPLVIIHLGIKPRGHNSKEGPSFIRRRGGSTMTPFLEGSQFNMKNPLNPEYSPLNQDPMGRNSMGSKFNPTSAGIYQGTFEIASQEVAWPIAHCITPQFKTRCKKTNILPYFYQ